jgi:hypothetical protein
MSAGKDIKITFSDILNCVSKNIKFKLTYSLTEKYAFFPLGTGN